MSQKTISIIGLGYIGLPAAAMFAINGAKVVGVDINQYAVDTINQGKIHIIEPGLQEIVEKAIFSNTLYATTTPVPADAFIIAVPTPFESNHKPDLSYIKAVAKSLAPVLKKGDTIILESTSPVGTTEMLVEWLKNERSDLKYPVEGDNTEPDIYVAYCPERVLPGQVIRELIENDRIIGGITDVCSEKAIEIYKIFVKGELVKTNARTAEMSKLTENAFRDVNIAFANELSLISEQLNINVWELISLANRHPRVNILQPGCGVGGHCIAVDPWFIVDKTPELANIIRTARQINDKKPDWVIEKINNAIKDFTKKTGKPEKDVNIVCYGLSFKPDIDDLRESPALMITEKLMDIYPKQVYVVEPNYNPNIAHSSKEFNLISYEDSALIADVAVLLVNHKEFVSSKPNFNANTAIVDTKGIWG